MLKRKFLLFSAIYPVSRAVARECDPNEISSLFSALRCQNGGYEKFNQEKRNSIANQEKSLEILRRQRDEAQSELNRLQVLNRNLDVWLVALNSIELSVGRNSALVESQRLERLKESMKSHGLFELAQVNRALGVDAKNPRLLKRKSNLERIRDTLVDLIIPSDIFDIIPLKKPWRTLKMVWDLFNAISDNWFES
jgi:hypothetical protein